MRTDLYFHFINRVFVRRDFLNFPDFKGNGQDLEFE